MREFLVRVSRWVPVVGTIFASVGLYLVATVTPSGHGWLWGCVGAGLTGLVVALQGLREWQINQASKISVPVEAECSTLPSLAGSDEFIDSIVQRERASCLESLNSPKKSSRSFASQQKRPEREVEDFDEYLKQNPARPSMSLRDLTELERKEEDGEDLTEDERESLSAIREKMRPALEAISRSLSNPFGRLAGEPDTRTPEDYIREVDNYISNLRDYLNVALLRRHIEKGFGSIKVKISNGTDRILEDVQIILTFQGKVTGSNEAPSLPDEPSKPREFGKRKPLLKSYLGPSSILGYRTDHFSGALQEADIDNSGSCSIKYLPLTVRPHSTEWLDDIHLITREEPGNVLEGTWTATARNVDGQASGRFEIAISHEGPSLEHILFDTEDDEASEPRH
jgi:hypothetical protein